MALIKCSECGREISDKSVACIHCGNPISVLKDKTPEQGKLVVTKENSHKVEEANEVNSNQHNNSTLKNITWIILVVILAFAGVFYFNYRNAEIKKQASVLHEIYIDIEQAYYHTEEAFTMAATVLSAEKKYWDTDLEAALGSVINKGTWVKSDVVSARELLERIDTALETNVKASQFLPKQFNELKGMRDYIRDYFNYMGARNPETDARFKTGPEWMSYFEKMVVSLNEFDELKKNFLSEINRLR